MEESDHILDAPVEEARTLEYAGFWIRTAAYIIDVIILAGVDFIIGQFIGYPWSSIASLILGVSYFAYMESSEHQATLGKIALGIRVGDTHGNRITMLNAIGRYFAKVL